MKEEEEEVKEEEDEAPVLARDERTRGLHRLLQIIIDFMVDTPAFLAETPAF